MTIQRGHRTRFLLALALAQSACAVPVATRSDELAPFVRTSIRVQNESAELVHVLFVGDNGQRLRIGSVPPYSSATFAPGLSRIVTGKFITHRSSMSAGTALMGAVEPFFLEGKAVLIRVGAGPEFDFWHADLPGGPGF